MDTNYKQPIENFNTQNKNQTTLGEHAHRKQCGPPPQQGRQKLIQKNINNQYRWLALLPTCLEQA